MNKSKERKIGETLNAITDELKICLGSISEASAENALMMIEVADRIFCAGAGRSGLAVRGFAMRLMHLGKTVHVMGDITTPGIKESDLLIVASGSGRTASLVAAVKKAKGIGVKVLLLTIDPDSPIGKMANFLVKFPAPSEKVKGGGYAVSIQPMGALFEQSLLIFMDSLIVTLMNRLNQTSSIMFENHANLE
ncbi:MAG: 6-phospho-3-hexuloisomerase [Deltaproteobacteria bacterium]|jgi:6-phospho-3-hexuloisomerase|nr:6-phospho-3-hexuloisomerase [Deltaproteobacteria bacterium]